MAGGEGGGVVVRGAVMAVIGMAMADLMVEEVGVVVRVVMTTVNVMETARVGGVDGDGSRSDGLACDGDGEGGGDVVGGSGEGKGGGGARC